MFFIAKEKSLKYSHVTKYNSKFDIFVWILVLEKTTVTVHFHFNVTMSFCASYWTKRWRHYDVALLTGHSIMHNSNVPTVAKVHKSYNFNFQC